MLFMSPCCTSNLISISQLVDENYKISFFLKKLVISCKDQMGKMMEQGLKCEKLFPLNLHTYPKILYLTYLSPYKYSITRSCGVTLNAY